MIKSVLVAAAIGAAVLWIWEQTAGQGCASDTTAGLLPGAIVGAGVQVGVRLLGVS